MYSFPVLRGQQQMIHILLWRIHVYNASCHTGKMFDYNTVLQQSVHYTLYIHVYECMYVCCVCCLIPQISQWEYWWVVGIHVTPGGVGKTVLYLQYPGMYVIDLCRVPGAICAVLSPYCHSGTPATVCLHWTGYPPPPSAAHQLLAGLWYIIMIYQYLIQAHP